MKTTRSSAVMLLTATLICGSASAKDKVKGKGATLLPAPPAPGKVAGKEPLIKATVVLSTKERDIIHGYVKSCTVVENGKNPKGLPPGLAKKVARGGDLPPGWQKKCVRGEIMPAVVFKHCHPLPHELVVKLPPPPVGTILVTIDGKIVRLAKASMEILDVFDVL